MPAATAAEFGAGAPRDRGHSRRAQFLRPRSGAYVERLQQLRVGAFVVTDRRVIATISWHQRPTSRATCGRTDRRHSHWSPMVSTSCGIWTRSTRLPRNDESAFQRGDLGLGARPAPDQEDHVPGRPREGRPAHGQPQEGCRTPPDRPGSLPRDPRVCARRRRCGGDQPMSKSSQPGSKQPCAVVQSPHPRPHRAEPTGLLASGTAGLCTALSSGRCERRPGKRHLRLATRPHDNQRHWMSIRCQSLKEG